VQVLESLAGERRTVIVYETPHRIVRVLEDMDAVFGDVLVVIAREMTKSTKSSCAARRKNFSRILSQNRERRDGVLFNLRMRTGRKKKSPQASDRRTHILTEKLKAFPILQV